MRRIAYLINMEEMNTRRNAPNQRRIRACFSALRFSIVLSRAATVPPSFKFINKLNKHKNLIIFHVTLINRALRHLASNATVFLPAASEGCWDRGPSLITVGMLRPYTIYQRQNSSSSHIRTYICTYVHSQVSKNRIISF